ncbi:MAG: Glutamate racemase (EC [uncultured Paraburkholderia sp.]|nr:MAG: Glutamate racemase (EC [uncultured Paraburkholderia sp.]
MPAESSTPNASIASPGAASRAPVGIFDSGLGDLSVLRAVRAQSPDEALLYVADSLYAPYGARDDDFIADRTLAIGEWLVKQGAKALVVACNTATAQSIALVREKLPIPLVGVEPGIKPAALQSRTRVAGMLATQVTLRSARFQALLERVLEQHGMRAAPQAAGAPLPRFYSTDDGTNLRQLVAALLNIDAHVERVLIPSRRTAALASQPV